MRLLLVPLLTISVTVAVLLPATAAPGHLDGAKRSQNDCCRGWNSGTCCNMPCCGMPAPKQDRAPAPLDRSKDDSARGKLHWDAVISLAAIEAADMVEYGNAFNALASRTSTLQKQHVRLQI